MTKQPKNAFSSFSIIQEGMYKARYLEIQVLDYVGNLGKDIAEKLLKALKDETIDKELDVLRKSYKVRVYTKTCTEEMPLHLKFARAVTLEGVIEEIADEKIFEASKPIEMRVKKVTVTVQNKLFGGKK